MIIKPVLEQSICCSNSTSGREVLEAAFKDPASMMVFRSDDKYYVSSESVERYMDAIGCYDYNKVMHNIAEANSIKDASCLKSVGFFLNESIEVPQEVLAEAAEDNAATFSEIEKAYYNLLNQCKSKANTLSDIDYMIKSLKECVKDMQDALKAAKGKVFNGGRFKYALKNAFPFVKIFNKFKKKDWMGAAKDTFKLGLNTASTITVFANLPKTIQNIKNIKNAKGLVDAAGAVSKAGKGVSAFTKTVPIALALDFGIGLADYTHMLEKKIKETQSCINFLEVKRRELDKSNYYDDDNGEEEKENASKENTKS